MRGYSIYGTTFTTTLPFEFPLPPSSLPPQLSLTEQAGTLSLDGAELLSATPEPYVNDAGIQAAYRLPGEDVLLCTGEDQLIVREREIVYAHSGKHEPRPDLMEVRVIGSAFAWWLLQQGRLPLHAGALVLDGEAVLFTATSGMGKSSLMASLIAQGHPLLSDDFVTIHPAASGPPLAASAYPQMRMWPETIERFIGPSAAYPTVFFGGTKRRVEVGGGWGRFLEGTYPVSRIYLLERQPHGDGDVQVNRLSGHEGFMRLLTAVLLGSSFPLADLQRVWPTLQQITDHVPVFELSYPSGWERLPDVHRAILLPQ